MKDHPTARTAEPTRTYQDRVVSQRTLVEQRCSLCGTPKPVLHRENWNGDAYKVERITIESFIGERVGGELWGTKREYDVCCACFLTKVEPFLASLGARPCESEY